MPNPDHQSRRYVYIFLSIVPGPLAGTRCTLIMPPPSDDAALNLRLLDETYSVLQLKPDEAVPDDFLNLLIGKTSGPSPENPEAEKLISITRTSEEISVIYNGHVSGYQVPQWRCIKIMGPMNFGMFVYFFIEQKVSVHTVHMCSYVGLTGIMCEFTTPLKHAGVPIFALSTW